MYCSGYGVPKGRVGTRNGERRGHGEQGEHDGSPHTPDTGSFSHRLADDFCDLRRGAPSHRRREVGGDLLLDDSRRRYRGASGGGVRPDRLARDTFRHAGEGYRVGTWVEQRPHGGALRCKLAVALRRARRPRGLAHRPLLLGSRSRFARWIPRGRAGLPDGHRGGGRSEPERFGIVLRAPAWGRDTPIMSTADERTQVRKGGWS